MASDAAASLSAGQMIADPTEHPSRPAAPGPSRPLLTRLLPMVIVIIALGGFMGIVISGYYFLAAPSNGADGVAPLVSADKRPDKIKPENPGGLDVPHQDKDVYNELAARKPAPPRAERLLPPHETPSPRVGQPIGVANSGATTLREAPPRPPGSPAPVAPSVPAPPDVTPPPPSAVTSQITIPPAASAGSPLPRAPAPAAPPTPAAAVAQVQPPLSAAIPPLAARPVAGGLRVAIASVKTESDAPREWDRLRRQNPDGLAGVSPEFAPADLGDKGVFWRIYVGPAESNADAQARCGLLKQRNVDCFVARP